MLPVIELQRVRARRLNMESRSFCGKALDIAAFGLTATRLKLWALYKSMSKIDLIKTYEINREDYIHQKILYGSAKVIEFLKAVW